MGVGHDQVQSCDYRCLRRGCAGRRTPHTRFGASASSRLARVRACSPGCRRGGWRCYNRDRSGSGLGRAILWASLLPARAGLLRRTTRLLRAASGILRTLSGGNRGAAPPRRGGRPSHAATALLGEHILDVATELFLAQGYGVTSIEAVAQHARISKRTFYHRFPDKAALFSAVVRRIVAR